jgi:hypothetical protein
VIVQEVLHETWSLDTHRGMQLHRCGMGQSRARLAAEGRHGAGRGQLGGGPSGLYAQQRGPATAVPLPQKEISFVVLYIALRGT